MRQPLSAVQRIDRVGDPLWNGTLIGAAIGGGSAMVAMARACSNTNCADSSANLDPRLTLLGSLIGGALGRSSTRRSQGERPCFRRAPRNRRTSRKPSPSSPRRPARGAIR